MIPYIGLASLGATLLDAGHDVKILEQSVSKDPRGELHSILNEYRPDFVGIGFTSFLSGEAKELAKTVKDFNGNTVVIGGGVHCSVLPEETLRDTDFDVVVIGEGEITLKEIVDRVPLEDIDGIAYKDGKTIKRTKPRELIEDLDSLPVPAWHLYDLKKYHAPRINARRNPVGSIETSRGCPYRCIYCNKSVFGYRFRGKSAKRIVDEMEAMLEVGFKEIHIQDDMFSMDLQRAKATCDEIIRRGLKFPWNIYNGVRCASVDLEFFQKLKRAGCYRVSMGIESGNQEILDRIQKGITIEQIKEAVRLAKEAGVEILTFFLVGLPGETEDTMRQTIEFAKELDCDLNKVAIATPIPGTPMFEEYEKKGLIRTHDWSQYQFHSKSGIAKHENLEYETIRKYYDLFYKELYLRPHFIWKRLVRGISTGDILYDIVYFLRTLKYKW